MRTFILMRQYTLTYAELAQKIAEIEARYDHKFEDVYEVLDQLLSHKKLQQQWSKRKRIGFK